MVKFLISLSKLEWSISNRVTQITNLYIVIIDWLCYKVYYVNLQINMSVRDGDRTACYWILLKPFARFDSVVGLADISEHI